MTPAEAVLAVVDAFDVALRARDREAAEAVWALNDPNIVILGSAPGEVFHGSRVADCLHALTSRPTAHGWRWTDRQVTVEGSVAWLVADAHWQTIALDGVITERPYTLTGVLVQGPDGQWLWRMYHGSEPLGTIG